MKRALIAISLLLAVAAPLCLMSTSAGAANVFSKSCSTQPNSSVCKEVSGSSNTNPFIGIIKAAINIISIIAGIAAVIGIMVSGLRMILAGGNAESVASARSGLIYSLVGVAVVVLAQSIVVFVLNKL